MAKAKAYAGEQLKKVNSQDTSTPSTITDQVDDGGSGFFSNPPSFFTFKDQASSTADLCPADCLPRSVITISEKSDYTNTDKPNRSGYKPVDLTSSYMDDMWKVKPRDHVKEFRVYITIFDGNDNGFATGNPDLVACEMRKSSSDMPHGKAPKRPNKWIEDLDMKTIAPHDDSYKHSGYSRGHLQMKHIAWILGANADWYTHTAINTSAQLQKFNAGIWLDMENKTKDYVDKYGKIWVICGRSL